MKVVILTFPDGVVGDAEALADSFYEFVPRDQVRLLIVEGATSAVVFDCAEPEKLKGPAV
jgi:hypothetical protein